MSVIRSCLRVATVLAAGLAVTGCGLSEYESKMQEEQSRADRYDEDLRLLEKPLDLSAPRSEQPEAINVFLRPPRTTRTSLSDKKEEQRWLLFYWYKGGNDLWVDVFVGWGAADKDLKAELLKAMGVTAQPQVQTITTTPVTDSPGVELDYFTVDGAATKKTYHIYVETRRKVAVMYAVASDRPHKDANDAIRASINSLALDNDAVKAKKAYDELKKRMPATPATPKRP